MTRSFMGDDFVREFPNLETLGVVNEMSEMEGQQASSAQPHNSNSSPRAPSPREPSPTRGSVAVSSGYFVSSATGESTASV